jgi:hypothetical protein
MKLKRKIVIGYGYGGDHHPVVVVHKRKCNKLMTPLIRFNASLRIASSWYIFKGSKYSTRPCVVCGKPLC